MNGVIRTNRGTGTGRARKLSWDPGFAAGALMAIPAAREWRGNGREAL